MERSLPPSTCLARWLVLGALMLSAVSVAESQFTGRSTRHNPIIFVPGDGSSRLEAKLNKTSRVHPMCNLHSDWFHLWLNVHLLAPVAFDCLSDNLRLSYDAATRTTANTEGVQIRPASFGSVDSVTYLDTTRLSKTDYYERIVATLETRNGLVRDVDMFGAPFDFRKAPNELADFFRNLTRLVELQFVRNNYRPVTLLCHSMGCLNSVYLLNGQSQRWRDVYIRRLVALGAPWDGSFKAISALLFGDNLGIPLLNRAKLQQLQMTFPSLMYLFPKAPGFHERRVLVQTPTSNYSLANLDAFFRDFGFADQLEMWRDTRPLAASLQPPNVELWCLYSSGLPTPSRILFDGPTSGSAHRIQMGDGDGSVNLESLEACNRFQLAQQKPVHVRVFERVSHINMLRGPEAADFISAHILSRD